MGNQQTEVTDGAPFLFEGDVYEVKVLAEKTFEAHRPEAGIRPCDVKLAENAGKAICEYRTVSGKRADLQSVPDEAAAVVLVAAELAQEITDRQSANRNASAFVRKALADEATAFAAKVRDKIEAGGIAYPLFYLPGRVMPRKSTYLSLEG